MINPYRKYNNYFFLSKSSIIYYRKHNSYRHVVKMRSPYPHSPKQSYCSYFVVSLHGNSCYVPVAFAVTNTGQTSTWVMTNI